MIDVDLARVSQHLVVVRVDMQQLRKDEIPKLQHKEIGLEVWMIKLSEHTANIRGMVITCLNKQITHKQDAQQLG